MDRVPLSHLVLALFVAAVWGTNFVVISVGLDDLPPLLFAGLRFLLVAAFAVVVPRPRIGWGSLAAYGLLIGAGQFGPAVRRHARAHLAGPRVARHPDAGLPHDRAVGVVDG
jgi:drug/metabolite transporter (DMT)-like permease